MKVIVGVVLVVTPVTVGLLMGGLIGRRVGPIGGSFFGVIFVPEQLTAHRMSPLVKTDDC